MLPPVSLALQLFSSFIQNPDSFLKTSNHFDKDPCSAASFGPRGEDGDQGVAGERGTGEGGRVVSDSNE